MRADIYGITFGEQLIRINTTTGAGTLIGNIPGGNRQPFGIGFRGSQLYTFDQVNDRVVELDPATGAVLNTINIGIGDLVGEGGFDFRSDGIGFLSSSSGPTGQLFRFDVTVPSSTPITGPNQLVPSMDGLAFDSADVLYGLNQGGTSGGSKLYTINQTTGVTALVGSLGVGANSILGGLTFDTDGQLYAAVSDSNGVSSLYRVNKSTGAATLVGNIGFNEVSGLATQPAQQTEVPEPGTLMLFGMGAVAALRYRRRR